MAAADVSPADIPADSAVDAKSDKPEKLAKVDKPDEEQFKKDLADAEKTLAAVTEKMTALRAKLDGSVGKGPNSGRIADLRGQLNEVKEKQAALKSGKSGIQTQLDALKVKLDREQNELKLKKGKIHYRNTDEIDREIKELEREVDSGKLKLVDEKKNLKRMSDLKGIRKQMAVFSTMEESIKSDISKRKTLQDELSSSTQTPEAKALSEEFSRVREELQKIKDENDDAFAKRGELRDQRTELQKERDKAYEHKKAIQDAYFKQRDAHRAWNEQNRKAQNEKYWKTREEEERERIERNANARLEEASQDAFASQIWKCENLLRLFGGGEGPSGNTPKTPTPVAAPTARAVETTGLTKLTSKKDRDADDGLFGPKKGKPKTKPTTPKTTTKPKGLVLSMDVMQTLGELGVSLPTSDENVKTTIDELKAKLSYYKENQSRVTEENIAKAKADNEAIGKKQMATFIEKRDADLSGRKTSSRGPRKGTPSGTKGKEKEKGKINGNGNGVDSNGSAKEDGEEHEKETTPEA